MAGSNAEGVYQGHDHRAEAPVDRDRSRPDLQFRIRSLSALAQVYACADSKEKFMKDF